MWCAIADGCIFLSPRQARGPGRPAQGLRLSGLRRRDLPSDPVELFQRWFNQVLEAEILEPNAMVLSCCEGEQPNSRTLLLKAFDARGLVFFTNTLSRKARAIAANARVSLLFPWYALERQLSIEGKAQPISAADAFAYFRSRPRGSQIGAWVLQQSRVISSRALLDAQWQALQYRFRQGDIPLPPAWGGYRVEPTRFEVWQGLPNRLHDRFCYRRAPASEQPTEPTGWNVERLAP